VVGIGVDPVTSRSSGAIGSFVADLAFATNAAESLVGGYFSAFRA
jgi:hypothetical protein